MALSTARRPQNLYEVTWPDGVLYQNPQGVSTFGLTDALEICHKIRGKYWRAGTHKGETYRRGPAAR